MVIETRNPEKLFRSVAAILSHSFPISSCVSGNAWRYNNRNTFSFVQLIILYEILVKKLNAVYLWCLRPLYHEQVQYQRTI
jgi:hypothetical protein